MGLSIFDFVFGGFALCGLVFIAIDYFHFKPKRQERARQMDRLYKQNMETLFKSIKGDNKS